MGKQSLRQWYIMCYELMLKKNFQKSSFDWCVYFKEIQKGKFIYLLLYVDDMVIACVDMEEAAKLKAQLNTEF